MAVAVVMESMRPHVAQDVLATFTWFENRGQKLNDDAFVRIDVGDVFLV